MDLFSLLFYHPPPKFVGVEPLTHSWLKAGGFFGSAED